MSTLTIASPIHDWPQLLAQLAPGERRLLPNVDWEEYERLLEERGNACVARITYDQGVMELMAPLYPHERDKETITAFVRVLAKACGYKLQAAGSTTLKLPGTRGGAEPDTCFFIQHAAAVIGKQEYDLRVDPPPDLVVEVDVTSSSLDKRDLYARLGVPELWRYDGEGLEMLELSNGQYMARTNSPTFSFVSATDLATFIEQSKSEGQDAALESFTDWVTQHRPPRSQA